jgi:predicted phosphodiesterase
MRIALLSDIHGNPLALDAVLADVERRGGVDAYIVVGGLAAIGPDPIGVLERLAALPNAGFVRGNTDRYVVTGDRPPPTPDDALADLRLLPALLEVTGSFAWTQGAVVAAGRLDWLAELQLERRLTLPDGTRLLCVHAAPGTDDGDGNHPAQTDAERGALVADCAADLVCVGHTHWALDRTAGGVRAVNLGSVSNPFPPDLRASYVLLDADAHGYRLQHQRVDYDHAAVIELTRRVRFPGGDHVISFMRGRFKPRWMVQA